MSFLPCNNSLSTSSLLSASVLVVGCLITAFAIRTRHDEFSVQVDFGLHSCAQSSSEETAILRHVVFVSGHVLVSRS